MFRAGSLAPLLNVWEVKKAYARELVQSLAQCRCSVLLVVVIDIVMKVTLLLKFDSENPVELNLTVLA